MTGDRELKPAPETAPRCSDWSRSISLDPRGTAFSAETVTFIATPGAWPKPVFEHSLLRELSSQMETTSGPTRVLAFKPETEDEDDVNDVLVYVYAGRPMRGRAYRVRPQDLARMVAAPNDRWRADRPAPERVLAVCTQGSHDVCCGTEGTRFATDAETREVTVFRVSHTGGHRFAPTALFLPDGRMWAHMDMDLLDRIMRRSGDPADLVHRCRGSMFAPRGPGQIAECAVFARHGWNWQSEIIEVDDNEVVLTGGGRSYRVTLDENRTVPTIACRAQGGEPAKSATEFVVSSIIEL